MSIYGQLQQHSCHECSGWSEVSSPSYAAPRGSPYGHAGQHPQAGPMMSQAMHQPHLGFPVAAGVGQHKVLAERYKTKLCRNYVETGVCPYEYRCMFAHGEHELRTTEMNLRDGLTTEDAIRHYKRIMQYKALEEMAGIAQPPDYESTLSNQSLLDETQRSHSTDEASAGNDWAGSGSGASRNASIVQFRLSSQPSFEQLSAAPAPAPALCYQNNPYAWRSFDELPETVSDAPENCRAEYDGECACADCLYQRARPAPAPLSRAASTGPYRSPAIARTIAEHSRRSVHPHPEPVYLRAPSVDGTVYGEVQMP